MLLKFTKDEISYLQGLGLIEKSSEGGEDIVSLEIEASRMDEMRDFLGERLQEVGFNAEYGTTDEGKMIESLVDKLFVG